MRLVESNKVDNEIISNLHESEDKDYRRSEFNKLPLDDEGYGYKLKITSVNGETKWLDITKEELAEIEKILTA